MRILAISELYPWPAVDGYRQRLTHMLAGLAREGTVDLLCLRRAGHPHDPREVPEDFGKIVEVDPGEPVGSKEWMPQWASSGVPRRLLTLDWSRARDELRSWDPRPDLIWYSHVDSWFGVHEHFKDVPAIVDFDNLENLAMRLRRSTPPRFPPGAGAAERARVISRWGASRSLDLVDERRWDRTQRECAEEVGAVVVCSPLDVERSGVPNAVVIPNGSVEPRNTIADRTALLGKKPTFMFVGALDYEPNSEAVEWLVREVWPLVLERRPDAIVRIIGRGRSHVEWVDSEPGVELLGAVEDIQAELDRTDVSLVPIRVGAGTRLKVVEAMSNRIPLVSTSVGCEGISVVDGVHALIADDPRRFADACLRMVAEPLLRQELSEAAAELYEANYTWASIERRVGDLARKVAR